jgi:hypothetical protein
VLFKAPTGNAMAKEITVLLSGKTSLDLKPSGALFIRSTLPKPQRSAPNFLILFLNSSLSILISSSYPSPYNLQKTLIVS